MNEQPFIFTIKCQAWDGNLKKNVGIAQHNSADEGPLTINLQLLFLRPAEHF